MNTHKKELVNMMPIPVFSAVLKMTKPIVWIREDGKSKWAYCMNCLVGTTCTSARMSNVDTWVKRHVAVCKADWNHYKALYEPEEGSERLLEMEELHKLQQEVKEKEKQIAELNELLAKALIEEVEQKNNIAKIKEMEKYTHTKCWICEEPTLNKQYETHVQSHRSQLNPMKWFKLNADEYSRMVREGPVARSPCGKIGFCAGCKQLLPFSKAGHHTRLCNVEGHSVTKWWKTAQDLPDYLPTKEATNPIVGNPEPPKAPPTPPTLSVQTDSTEAEPRNEIHYDSSDSETASDDDSETRSVVSCSPMDYWDMDSPGVQSIFDALSDIVEQEMRYKEARSEYSHLLKELKPIRESIGKPYKVLEAYILDEYTPKDLENFLSLQD
jgi:hypothetical protein